MAVSFFGGAFEGLSSFKKEVGDALSKATVSMLGLSRLPGYGNVYSYFANINIESFLRIRATY